MNLECYIDGQPLDVDAGTVVRIESTSPVLDTVLTVGDFSQAIRLPFTPNNKRIMGFAHRKEMANKRILYTDFEIVDKTMGRLRGSFMLQETVEDYGDGYYDGDFFTNLIDVDIFNTRLADLVTKTVNLGSTTAAIIAAAKAQNAAAMSTDGTTGAVMKFVPHTNHDFYDSANTDWNLEADVWKVTEVYEAGTAVRFPALGYFELYDTYVVVTTTVAGENPRSHPAKFALRNSGVLNHWDAEDANFRTNQTQKIGGTFFTNQYALVPWLQVHDMFRAIASTLGYTIRGTYMQDTIEQRAMAYSNFAIDARDAYQVIFEMYDAFQDANIGLVPTDGGIYAPEDFTEPSSIVALTPTEENNGQDLLDEATQLITVDRKGAYRFTGECTLFVNDGGDPCSFWLYILDASNAILAFREYTFAAGTFPPEGIPFAWELIWEYDYVGADGTVAEDIKPGFRFTGVGLDPLSPGVVANPRMEISNLMIQGLNRYDGAVRYADHVPDMTVADYIEAFRVGKNLFVGIDSKARTIVLDYADPLLSPSEAPEDFTPFATGAQRTRLYPKRRFELQYTNLPSPAKHQFPGYTVIDPLASITELSANVLTGYVNPSDTKAVLIQNQNAWYITGKGEDGSHRWILGGHNYPTLRVEAEGELMSIRANMGPVPMGLLRDQDRNALTAPTASGTGRSSAFPLDGSRPPLLIAYWVGIDTSVVAEGYPYATTTGRNGVGTTVLSRDMALLTIFTDHWKRTLEMLVLEERYTAIFHLRPDQRKLLNFARALLLGHVPIIPIRTAEAIGGTSRAIEIEARKVKKVDIEVLGGQEVADLIPYGVGGTEYIWNGYQIHEFTEVGEDTFTVINGILDVEYLIVSGGGGGGRSTFSNRGGSGGGGAGGLYHNIGSPSSLLPGDYAVVIGAGGAGATSGTGPGNNGSVSSFNLISPTGGGGGGTATNGQGADGGSGGGGAGKGTPSAALGGDGDVSYGNDGAAGGVNATEPAGGGGGGAGGVGAATTNSGRVGGGGGPGLLVEIRQDDEYFSGGGGGCRWQGNIYPSGIGGVGGGGDGADMVAAANNITGAGENGAANTGGGGGGGTFAGGGGNGGSGIVIIRYPI